MNLWILALIIFLILIIIVCCLIYFNNQNVEESQTLEQTREALRDRQNIVLNLNNTLNNTFNGEVNNIDIPLYYINLERSRDRNEFMIDQLNKHRVSHWKRIEAVNGKADPTIRYINSFSGLTNSEIGCTLSHLKALKTAYEDNLDYVLIMEDDASFDFVALWDKSLSQYIKELNCDWTILQLHSNYEYHKSNEPYICPKQNFWTALAYVVNRSGMKLILDKAWNGSEFLISKKFANKGEADWYIYELGDFKKRYITNPPLFTPNNIWLPSTIHDDHTHMHLLSSVKHYDLYIDRVYRSLSEKNDYPKIIFQTWKSLTIIPDNMKYWFDTWSAYNPNYFHLLWDDEMNREFIRKNFKWFLKTYDGYQENIKRVDAVRYFFLYMYGGIYADMDFECLRSFDQLFLEQQKYDVILGRMDTKSVDSDQSLPNAIMISKPKQEFWLCVFYTLLKNSRENTVEKCTGPAMLLQAYNLYEKTKHSKNRAWYRDIIGKLNEKPVAGTTSIQLCPPAVFYPLSWSMNQEGRVKSLENNDFEGLTRNSKELYPEAYAVTYWTYSWAI